MKVGEDLAQAVVERKRTRSLGELRWFEVQPTERGPELLREVIGGPLESAVAAEAWLKMALGEKLLLPGVYELHRVVKRVEPRAVVVPQRFAW